MFIIKTKKLTFILTLCLSSAPIKAMDELRVPLLARDASGEDFFDRGGPTSHVVEDARAVDEDAIEKKRWVADLASEVDEDSKESLAECSLEQLRNVRAALSLIPFAASSSTSSEVLDLSPKSYYLMGYAAYKGANWNGNVTRLLNSGLGERASELCTILSWAAEGLDSFTEQTVTITASLDIDTKVAVMNALSPRPAELEGADYVAELKRKVNEISSVEDIPTMVEETRRMFFASAREKFERLQAKK